ncbi:hypothetical protein COO91_03614 [Nostoc flagelliforme CCNUN1]|uniref:Uncharacterized protein n=1 Tax=Nostoc flagelliforme CCNUN1 TaxID=2038116 RepID=A0A2K8SQI7_9NOSO|nr:hypothetical protein COO91_03614 [Nostoc flagelliforme CCNUN1]
MVISFGKTRGIAAFNVDRLQPYQALPGGFDIVPQGNPLLSLSENNNRSQILSL